MPLLTTLISALVVSSSLGLAHDEKVAACNRFTVDARQELTGALRAFRAGDRSWAGSTLKNLLLNGKSTVGFEDQTRDPRPLRRALASWKSAVADCPYVAAKAGSRPDVVIRFVPQIDGCDDEEGQISFEPASCATGGHRHAEVLLQENTHRGSLKPREICAVVAHELGHLLGLEDSADGKGLMGRFDPDHLVTSPTATEAAAVRTLRHDVREALRVVKGSPIGRTQNFNWQTF